MKHEACLAFLLTCLVGICIADDCNDIWHGPCENCIDTGCSDLYANNGVDDYAAPPELFCTEIWGWQWWGIEDAILDIPGLCTPREGTSTNCRCIDMESLVPTVWK